MHKFLAQAALVDGVLRFQRSFDWGGQGRRSDGRRLLMDMGLNRQTLEEESQQSEKRHPLLVGGGLENGASWARHGRFRMDLA
ncbi:MAG TPA: hypothetical protein VGH23_20895 [Rhizomicrobium sp.]|jgi:hypothetical protein